MVPESRPVTPGEYASEPFAAITVFAQSSELQLAVLILPSESVASEVL